MCKDCSKVKLHGLVGPINSFLWIWISWIPWISRLQFLLQVFMMNFWDILQDKRLKLIMRFVRKLIADIIQELFQIEITTSSVANRILSMTAAFSHKCILLPIFFDFDLSFTASQCLKFLIFPWRTLFLIKIFYILVQLWQQKLICYFNHLSGKNHAATMLSDFHCSYYYDTNIIDEPSIRKSENKTNKAVKYSKITTISSIIKI